MIDTHLHLWDVGDNAPAWLVEHPVFNSAHTPVEYHAEFVAADLTPPTGAIVVEADRLPADALNEVIWAKSQAANSPIPLLGMVAHAPIDRPAELEKHFEALRETDFVVGIRRLFQDEGPGYITRDEVLRGAAMVAEAGWPFDACIRWWQMEELIAFAKALPQLTIVLDHLGKPPLREPEKAGEWEASLARLAEHQNVMLKLSGLPAEADPDKDLHDQVARPLRHAVEVFGTDRLIYGSDWAISGHSPTWQALVADVVGAEVIAATGVNATRIYGLAE